MACTRSELQRNKLRTSCMVIPRSFAADTSLFWHKADMAIALGESLLSGVKRTSARGASTSASDPRADIGSVRRRAIQFVVKVAVARPLHNSLCARKLQTLVVAFTKCGVALAGEQVSDLAEAHVAIHLGIAAARDVKDIARLGLFFDLYFHGACDLPQRLTIDKGLHRCLAANFRRKLLGLFN